MINNARVAAILLKEHGHQLSDEDRDVIWQSVNLDDLAEEIQELGPPFNPREVEVLAYVVDDMDDDHDFTRDGDLWDDDLINKYAKYIHTYTYTYNDEALKVDPSTDLSEVHEGPMAQEVQEVNNAAVKKDAKSGYLTVDTGRLALMNASAIAELAREIQELKNGSKNARV